MNNDTTPHGDPGLSLAQSMVVTSDTPLLLLDSDLTVIAASASFCQAFALDPQLVTGSSILAMGDGEWNLPRLKSLLSATSSGGADIEKYEMDLVAGDGSGIHRLELSAHKLQYDDADGTRLLLSVIDQTDARAAEKVKDGLIADNVMLMKELQHRVANSLQIIASVLMQSARRVANDETRSHLQMAHNRVLSVAAIQKHLTATGTDDVELRPYLTQLCQSIGASMIAYPDELSIIVDSDDTIVPSATSISLGLIVTELVINSLKHAFPEDSGGKITVSYKNDPTGWTLIVADNGIGIKTSGPPAVAGWELALSKRSHANSKRIQLLPMVIPEPL
ncbi:sensor histidine kinase [Parasphingorhabdus sp.]|uniref:sensor histidine kinase n=1 Tax=Parasphingorhabdus sp. TaxID=2709688 RepID=UPI002F94FC70